MESLTIQDKFFRKFKRSILNVEKEIYNKVRNKTHKSFSQKRGNASTTNQN